jgi:hypothetical protein
MYRFIIYFLLSFAYSFNLFALEIGFGVEEDQKIELNKLRGQLICNLEADANDNSYQAQLDKSGISGIFNLNVKDIEKSTAEYELIVSEIINPEIHQDYTDDFLPLFKDNKVILKIEQFKNAEVAEKDDVVKRLNIHADAVAEVIINEQKSKVEFPVNIIFLKESMFTKKRGAGNIVSLRGAFEVDLRDFDMGLNKKDDAKLNMNFNFEGNSK